jgi:hypothetical protein
MMAQKKKTRDMSKVTRTLNQLHFEDLEPHRFEDLVRHLVYDFRSWKQIEATGRLGSDDGIDIRAVEGSIVEDATDDRDVEAEHTGSLLDRLWIFQCKRERSLGPRDVRKIIYAGMSGGVAPPYGYVLAAACEFSKKARDAFRVALAGAGVHEGHIWGKADLEDMLLLPKNDHILFAYFGISLQVRKRGQQAVIRSRLALKRKLVAALGGVQENFDTCNRVFLRDASEKCYPNAFEIPNFKANPRWRYSNYCGQFPPDHLAIEVGRYFAYAEIDTGKWDAMFDFNQADARNDNAQTQDDRDEYGRLFEQYCTYWTKNVSRENQVMLKVIRFIHYDRVLVLDDIGDCFNDPPHLLVEPNGTDGFFETAKEQFWLEFTHTFVRALTEKRTAFFPREIPES